MSGAAPGRAPRPGPGDLREFRRGAEWALAVATALELGIVDAMAAGPAGADALAARLGLAPRGVAVLLGALEGAGVARRDPDGWRLTGTGRAHLADRTCPEFEGDSLRHWLRSVRRWAGELERVVRLGREAAGCADGPGAGAPEDDGLAAFMAAMANRDPATVAGAADAIRAAAPGARTLLDVGGGPGAYARALVARGFEVTLLDRPEVVEYVGGAYGLADVAGLSLAAGDFLEELPRGPFDVILLANVTHIYGPATNEALVARAAARLAPGGLLAVLDFVRDVSGFAALFAITMLLNTEAGGTYGLDEYAAWMEAAGLERVRVQSLDPDRQLVLARRPEAE
ncbi:MAG: methyltransferase [Gemmatimonadota bacterium]|nr:methyltransferase [Gemmatimonadota bacterium]